MACVMLPANDSGRAQASSLWLSPFYTYGALGSSQGAGGHNSSGQELSRRVPRHR